MMRNERSVCKLFLFILIFYFGCPTIQGKHNGPESQINIPLNNCTHHLGLGIVSHIPCGNVTNTIKNVTESDTEKITVPTSQTLKPTLKPTVPKHAMNQSVPAPGVSSTTIKSLPLATTTKIYTTLPPTTDPASLTTKYSTPGENVVNNVISDFSHQQPSTLKNSKIGSTTSAGVAAGLCVVIAISGYVGLMVWKKIQSIQYRNSEMLLNEDDVGEIQDEDMKHFEAACIQIEA